MCKYDKCYNNRDFACYFYVCPKRSKKEIKRWMLRRRKRSEIKTQRKKISNYPYKKIVYIGGMTCNHCKTAVENAFCELPDCMAKVNLKRKSAEIFSKSILTEEQISKTIEKIGYNFEGCE